jgi:RNA polymerase sigma-70 factor (ECF subfamily)
VNDDELMVRTARGDEEAFRLLVTRWQGPILAFLERMLGSREDARDLGQETFVRVHAQAARYRPAGRFRSWLFRIAGNLARGQLRRRRILRWVRFDPGRHETASPADGADRDLERAELQQALRRALQGLPDRQRQALILRRYDDLSYEEIARIMGTSAPAVDALLQRARGSLKRTLAAGGMTS